MEIILGIISSGVIKNYVNSLVLLFLILFMPILFRGKIIIPKTINFLALILFSVSYGIIGGGQRTVEYYFMAVPIMAYYSGFMMSVRSFNKKKYEVCIRNCILAISVGFFSHAMLNFITNLDNESRNTIDIWSGEALAATLQGTFLIMILSMAFYVLICEKRKKYKLLLMVMIFLSLMYAMVLGTRTTLLICIIVFISSLIYYNHLNRKLKDGFILIGIIALVPLILYILYLQDFVGMQSYFLQSNMGERFFSKDTAASDSSRMEYWIIGIANIINYPFGGSKQISYAHNLWLDVGKLTGVVPFTFLVAYTAGTCKNLINVLKSKKYDIPLKVLIFEIYLGVLMNFMTEPILEGVPFLFGMFCVINGVVDHQSTKLNHIADTIAKNTNEERINT